MKTALKIFAPILFASLACSTAVAEDGFYLGGNMGMMHVDLEESSNPFNLGLQVGYHFSDMWAIEGQYTNSISDGSFDIQTYNYYSGSSSETVDFNLQTLAAYGVFRTRGDVYFKAKAGVLNESINSESDTGASVGAGLGFRVEETGMIELEATLVEQDVIYFSIGFNVNL